MIFRVQAVTGSPAVAPAAGVPRAPGCSFPGRSDGSGWSAGREGLQAGDRGGDLAGPGPACGEAQPQAEPPGFPAAGGPGQGEQLGPSEQVAGQRDDLAPDLVLGEALERQVPQPGVLGAADPVLAAGPAPVTEFQVRELAFPGAG